MDIYTEDILKLMKRLKKYRSIKFGKEGYDYEKAIKSDPIIRELSIKYLWVSDNLSNIVYEMNKRIAKDGIRIVEPSDDPLGVAWKKDIFGNVKQWEQIRKEIRCLILGGETLGDHQRRLQRTYHLYPDKIRKPGIPQADRNILVKLLWDEVAKEYENVSDEEKRQELDWRRAAGLCDRPRQKRRRKLNCSS
jgi:hypothetical protein